MLIINKGQSLIEIIIALSIFSVTAVAITRAVTSSVKNSRNSQEQKIALSLAQSELSGETERRNTERFAYFQSLPPPSAVFSSDGNYCIYKFISDVSLAELPSGTMFKVEVDIYWNWKLSGLSACDLSTANLDSYEHKVHLETKLIK